MNNNPNGSYLFVGDNSCFVKLWNSSMDLVSLDWLKENGDPNTQIWSVKKAKFVQLPDIVPFDSSLIKKFPITRFRSIDGLVDVIDTCPEDSFINPIWSQGRDLVNPMSTREGDVSEAYLLGLFFVIGEIQEVKKDKYQIMIKTNKIETLLDFKFTFKSIFPFLNIPSNQNQSGSKWSFQTKTNDSSSVELAKYWCHIFYIQNVAKNDLGNKRIPKCIINASLLSKKEFLRGYIDAQSDCNYGQISSCEGKVPCAQLFYLYKCLGMPVIIKEKNPPFINHFTIQSISKHTKLNGIIERKTLHLATQPNFYQILNNDKFTLGVGDGLVL